MRKKKTYKARSAVSVTKAVIPSFGTKDLGWTSVFIGNAIGSGILFLPIQAGIGGFWVFLFAAIVGYPLLYYSQRLFINVLASSKRIGDYTDIMKEYRGGAFSLFLSMVYFVAMLLALISYTIALNNDGGQELVDYQVTMSDWARNPLFSFFIITGLTLIVYKGEAFIFKVMTPMTFILIGLLFVMSLILIPYWKFDSLYNIPSPTRFLGHFFLTLPLIMSSIIFVESLSPAVISYRRTFGNTEAARLRLVRTVLIASIGLTAFVFFFALSCTLAMTTEEAKQALVNNVSSVAIISHYAQSSMVKHLGTTVSVFALITSFIGVLIGVREAMNGLLGIAVRKYFHVKRINRKFIDILALILIDVILWFITLQNFSAIKLIAVYKAPLLAILVSLVPAYLTYRMIHLRRFRSLSALLVIVMGVCVVASYFVQMIMK